MTNYCRLCRLGSLSTANTDAYCGKLPQIIDSCKKYLEKEIVETIEWNSVQNPFCPDCGQITSQLLDQDIQLQQIDHNIKELITQIHAKIFNGQNRIVLNQSSTDLLFANDEFSLVEVFEDLNQDQVINQHLKDDLNNDDDTEDNLEENLHEDSDSDPTYIPSVRSTTLNVSANNRKVDDVKHCKKQNASTNAKKEKAPEGKRRVTSSDLQLKNGNDGFVCPNPTCKKKFTRLDILQRHKCGSQTYECDTCGKSFSSPGSLKLHMQSHSGEKRHKCDTCGKCFGLPHHLRLHIRTHTGEKPFECVICKKRFTDSGYLAKHKLQHSTDENERRKYKCNICEKSYTLYSTLKSHLTLHTGETPHKCHICGKVCGRKGALKSHLMIHTKEKPLQCSVCSKSFSRASSLKMHIATHGDEKKFQCEQCGKSFFSSNALVGHIADNHGEKGEFICDVCGRLYKTKRKLEIHRRVHDRQKSDEKFQCVVCQRTYSELRSMTDHQKLAHTVTTYKIILCKKCGIEFDDFLTYHRHLKRRVAKSICRLKCAICKAITPSRCDLNSHFKEKHGDLQLPHPCQDCGKRFMSKKEAHHHRYNDCLAEKKPITIEVFGKNFLPIINKKKSALSQPGKQNVTDVKLFGENEIILSTQNRRSARFTNAKPKRRIYELQYSDESESEHSTSDKSGDEYEPEVSTSANKGVNQGENNSSNFGVEIKEETYIKEEPLDFSD